MISLYLARHGQTEENIARIFQGHLPGRLTVEGISQAEVFTGFFEKDSIGCCRFQ